MADCFVLCEQNLLSNLCWVVRGAKFARLNFESSYNSWCRLLSFCLQSPIGVACNFMLGLIEAIFAIGEQIARVAFCN